MRKVLSIAALMTLGGCGSTIDRSEVVDTTLSNEVASLDPTMTTAEMMVTDLNTTDDMGTMTDNMAAIDAMTATDGAYNPNYEALITSRAEQVADNLNAAADNMAFVDDE